jgi:DNA-binding CsgD family transcriptional regulator
MKQHIAAAGGHSAVNLNDNLIMTGSAASPLRNVLKAPFTRRAWAEVRYTLISLPLAICASAFTAAMIGNGALWAASADGVRGFGAASRFTAREHDVLALMAEGRSNSAIADRLAVSERAVEKHISNIFSKLGLPPSDSDHRRVLAVLAYLGP